LKLRKRPPSHLFFEQEEKKPLIGAPPPPPPDEEPEQEEQIDEAAVSARGYSPVMMDDVEKSRTSLRDFKNSNDIGTENVNKIGSVGVNETSINVPHVNFNRDQDNFEDKKKPPSAQKREPNYKYGDNGKESKSPNANSLNMDILEARNLHSVQINSVKINHHDSSNSLMNGKASANSSSNITDSLSKGSQNSSASHDKSKKNKSLACDII